MKLATEPRPTPEEVEYLVKEVYERLKDVVHMLGERYVRKAVDEVIDTLWVDPDVELIDFVYKIQMVRADFLQIIGRLRREVAETGR